MAASSAVEELNQALGSAQISGDAEKPTVADDGGVQVTCFSEVVNEVTLHFQIIRLQKQIYAWIGCNSTKMGHLYAAASTQPNNVVNVASLIGGASENAGSGIARRIVLKTGTNVVLACNIPKNTPMLEGDAERILVRKLIDLGYAKTKPSGLR